MHAYIDMEAFAGLQVDAALRQLLKTFRLPGELLSHLCQPAALAAGQVLVSAQVDREIVAVEQSA